jgi:hypothetical protein
MESLMYLQCLCPACGTELREVLYPPGSLLNRDQWNTVKAGDYYCIICTSDRCATGYRYYWKRELTQEGHA